MASGTLTLLCNLHLQAFPSPTGTLRPLTSPPRPTTPACRLSRGGRWPLGDSYKWSHAVFALLCLAHSTQQTALKVSPRARPPIKAAQRFHFTEGRVSPVSSANDGRLGCAHLWPPWKMMPCTWARAYRFKSTALNSGAHRPRTGPAGSHGRSMYFYLYSLLKY